mmetsp:Transcript_29863/g.75992  ORF Transcript_29863/g.75992 Transcript_29863/m.75992 type:complete len:190 (-) Transcript_29863:62-631(-)
MPSGRGGRHVAQLAGLLCVSAAWALSSHGALRATQPENPSNSGSIIDEINKMGRDLCENRPNDPRCDTFKDPPPTIAPLNTEAPTEAPTQPPATQPPPGVPVAAQPSSDLEQWGEHQPPVAPAPSKPLASSDLDHWGETVPVEPTQPPESEVQPQAAAPTAAPGAATLPGTGSAAPKALSRWGAGHAED